MNKNVFCFFANVAYNLKRQDTKFVCINDCFIDVLRSLFVLGTSITSIANSLVLQMIVLSCKLHMYHSLSKGSKLTFKSKDRSDTVSCNVYIYIIHIYYEIIYSVLACQQRRQLFYLNHYVLHIFSQFWHSYIIKELCLKTAKLHKLNYLRTD